MQETNVKLINEVKVWLERADFITVEMPDGTLYGRRDGIEVKFDPRKSVARRMLFSNNGRRVNLTKFNQLYYS